MNSKFSERIKELRIEKTLSQRGLANQLKIAQSTIARWEQGLNEPTISQLILLTQFFGVSADYLLGLED